MTTSAVYRHFLAGSTAIMLLGASTAMAADKASDPKQDLSMLRQLIEQQRLQLEQQQQALRAQQERLEALESQLSSVTTARSTPVVYRPDGEPPKLNLQEYGYGGRVVKVQSSSGTDTAPQPTAGQPAPQAERPPEVQALAEEGGVLLPRGKLAIEPSVEYTRSDVNRAEIAGFTVLPGIVVGNINVVEANRDTFVTSVTARYGLTNRLEIEAKVPYVSRDDTTVTRPLGTGASADVTTSATGDGLGDIEAAVHYQINRGGGGWPFLVGNLRVKSRTGKDPFEVSRDPTTNAETELPTGSGFWGIEPSITAILPSDPAVLFGNVSYLWNIERDVGGNFGKIDPGDAVGFNFGMGVSLNEDLSLNLGYDHKTVFKTEQNGVTATGSDTLQVGKLTFGGFYRISERTGLSVSIGAGVTDDAPDLTLNLRMPITLF